MEKTKGPSGRLMYQLGMMLIDDDEEDDRLQRTDFDV